MTEWLWTNLDEVLGLVLGLTTAGAFWFAYKGRNSVAAVIGLSGNALWWLFAVTVQAWMLLVPVAIMTFVHSFNLWKGLRRNRLAPAPQLTPEQVIEQLRQPDVNSVQIAAALSGLLSAQTSSQPCPECTHATSSHGPRGGCGIITSTGSPCDCRAEPATHT